MGAILDSNNIHGHRRQLHKHNSRVAQRPGLAIARGVGGRNIRGPKVPLTKKESFRIKLKPYFSNGGL